MARGVTPKQEARILRRRIDQINKLKVTALNKTLNQLKKMVITEHLSGPTTPSSVRKQSGTLSKSIVITKAALATGRFGRTVASATFTFTDPKAKVHIGKRGKRTKIRPVHGQFLAIPTSYARTKSGVPLGGPLNPRWGRTFVANDIIFGTKGRGKTALPLFTLRDEVVVPQRVDIKIDIVRPGEVIYKNHIEAGLDKVFK